MRTHVIGAVVIVGALSGCSGGGGSAAPARAAGAAALSRQQAQQVLSHYQAGIDKADQALDAKALTALETGPQLQMDTAAYKLHRATKQKYAQVGYTAPAFFIPRLTGFPRWFAADATDPKAKLHHALLFTQQSASAPWLLAADPIEPSGTPLPGIALDSAGLATPVAGTAALAVAPARLAAAHAELLTAGPKSPSAKALATGNQTSRAFTALQQARSGFGRLGVNLTTQFQPAGQPVYALRTKDGGAVVWYVLQQEETYAAKKPGAISVSGDLVGLAPAGKVKKQLGTTVLIQYLADVPAKGKANVSGIYRKAIQAAVR
jgi:hypothetical protein